MTPQPEAQLVVFETELGWMALVGSAGVVRQLTFAHNPRKAALAAVAAQFPTVDSRPRWAASIVERLQDFAAGAPQDLSDIAIDLSHLTGFARRVVEQCRMIPYGETSSYAQLAQRAGSARAARAVGNTMAANRYPLLVPCHRVVHADGRLGGFSASRGPRLKTRLLAMERRAVTQAV